MTESSTDPILIFDADGVLVEPWGFARDLETRFGISREQTRDFFSDAFQDCLTGGVDVRDVLPRFLERWGWNASLDEFIHTWMRRDDRPRHEVLDTIQRLRAAGYRCCLASNQEPRRAAYMAGQMGFAERFDALYFSCDLGSTKPAADFYRGIEQDLGVEPRRLHFWDDSMRHVEAARRRGWNAYLFEDIRSITEVFQPR